MSTYTYVPHPHAKERQHQHPPKAADLRIGRNAKIAAVMTKGVGSMWSVYFTCTVIISWMVLGTWGVLHHIDPYPFPFLLAVANVVELMLIFVILVGQGVLGQAADKRAEQTYLDAEAILHDVISLNDHLHAQDKTLNQGMALVETEHHPWIEKRKAIKAPRVKDELVGFNGRIAARMTRGATSMWAFYAAGAVQFGWIALAATHVIQFDPYPFAFLLFVSSLLQLILEFVIMVGQDVLGKAGDHRAEQTFLDAEAVLQECLQLQRHLAVQDEAIAKLCAYIEAHADKSDPVRATAPTQLLALDPKPTIE